VAASPVAASPVAASPDEDPGLPGPPWRIRPAAGPAGRPAIEIYAAGCIVDVLVAPALAARVLRGACSVTQAGKRWALAWGYLPPGAGLSVVFSRGLAIRRASPARISVIAGWFWVAPAVGRFRHVTVHHRIVDHAALDHAAVDHAAVDHAAVDLGGAGLGGADHKGLDLGTVNHRGTDHWGTDHGGVNLGGADLGGADLGGADLGGVNLGPVDHGGADYAGGRERCRVRAVRACWPQHPG
jgi:hypothetical protein